MNTKTELHSIEDIINLIDRLNINDMNIINEICSNCLNARFMPIQTEGHPAPKTWYIDKLKLYKYRIDNNLELPSFINGSVPFCLQDFYKPEC